MTTIQVRNTTILLGDVRKSLRTLPAGSVHCAATSPPYWGLRAYGTEPQVWGGSSDCVHEWGELAVRRTGAQMMGSTSQMVGRSAYEDGENRQRGRPMGCDCLQCGAWRGELGSEPTIEQFVSNIVDVFREVKRVLRDDAVCFINIGDSYCSQGGTGQSRHWDGRDKNLETQSHRVVPANGLKPKDLCLVPWRVALALQADGWYLRDVIVWHKPAPMPESITDRCTKSWEPIFMLAKSDRYFADMEAVKETATYEGACIQVGEKSGSAASAAGMGRKPSGNGVAGSIIEVSGRNLRNVWTLSTEPLSMPHFAAYPTSLPARCIKIGTSERGVCPTCGDPWRRTTTRKSIRRKRPNEYTKYREVNGQPNQTMAGVAVETTGWEPSCACGGDPVPATVLDPFLGSGSTSVAAERLGRHSIGCELNETYAREIAVLRINTALSDGEHKAVKPIAGQKELFAEAV